MTSTPSSSRIILTSAVSLVAALALTACDESVPAEQGPLEHGTVIAKRGHDAYTSPETNCRYVDSKSALTQSLSLPGRSAGSSSGDSGGSGKKTDSGTGSGWDGSGDTRREPPKKDQKGQGSDTSKNQRKEEKGPEGGKNSRRVCDPSRFHPARWEIQLKDGKRTGWKQIRKDVWNDVEKGDRF